MIFIFLSILSMHYKYTSIQKKNSIMKINVVITRFLLILIPEILLQSPFFEAGNFLFNQKENHSNKILA